MKYETNTTEANFINRNSYNAHGSTKTLCKILFK